MRHKTSKYIVTWFAFWVHWKKRNNRQGVSNTWPAGRMWTACRVYAARNIIKIPFLIIQTTVLCDMRVLFTPFCGPRRHFCLIVWPASVIFIKMWPMNMVEFETPVIGKLVLSQSDEKKKREKKKLQKHFSFHMIQFSIKESIL